MSDIKPGDKLASVDSAWGGPVIRGYGTVKRVTPTGIVVLDDDTRLKPSTFHRGEGVYEVRGATGWHRALYYPLDHKVTAEARMETRRRNAANAVMAAFDDWKSARDAQGARALAKAARDYAKEVGAMIPEPPVEAPHGYIDDPSDGEPCPACDDTGEVWFDVETASGRVREVMRPCGCGGGE